MTAFSTYSEGQCLGHIFGSITMTKPTALHVALFTTAPTDGAPGTEIGTSGTGYARQAVTFGISGASPTVASNVSQLTFGSATSDWGTVTHFGVFGTVSGSEQFLGWAALTASRQFLTGDQAQFAAGVLTISLD